MPILYTATYSNNLDSLRQQSPKVAELTKRIAAAIKPELQRLEPEDLENVLFIHADAVAQQIPSCVTRLAVWLNLLAAPEVKALEHREVAAFINEAASLGGLSGVVQG